ncbi:hypothetical protein Vretimale_8228 [Volvox reticuliferus]|uniref:Uncharacterized protein n=1 Tax=Volvox reticuliferus TaxID=1737510 RepID=A0A8J4GAW5_9CHLO|nr:hypothetical protein Vretimale_8228 [Volvox reticuliferus]
MAPLVRLMKRTKRVGRCSSSSSSLGGVSVHPGAFTAALQLTTCHIAAARIHTHTHRHTHTQTHTYRQEDSANNKDSMWQHEWRTGVAERAQPGGICSGQKELYNAR